MNVKLNRRTNVGQLFPGIVPEEVIKRLIKRKPPGEDKIINEVLKYGGQKLIEELIKLFQKINQGKIPQTWKSRITMPVFKKGKKLN